MKETFEDIIKRSLEGYTRPVPEHILKGLQSHYPKPGFRDFVSLHAIKISVITGVIISGIIAIFLFTNNKDSKTVSQNKAIEVQSNSVAPSNKSNNVVSGDMNAFNPIRNINQKTSENNANLQVAVNKKASLIFACSDTSVCGNEVLVKIYPGSGSLFAGANLKIEQQSESVYKISTVGSGVHYIKYKDETGNNYLADSMKICFSGVIEPKIEIIEEIKCAGDPLLLSVTNSNNQKLVWNIPDAEIESIGNDTYRIRFKEYSGQKEIISVSINNRSCECKTELEYQLPEKIKIKTYVTPEICSNKNGTVQIKTDHSQAHFLLDNTIRNSDGNFANLQHGKYNISVIYNNECFENIVVDIPENKHLNASFTYKTDPSNANRLIVSNNTSIDSRSYTKFSDIAFEWIVENERYYTDNPNLEFTNGGKQEVILIASYGDNCIDTCRTTVQLSNEIVMIPNIFSPNGDGISDLFIVKADNVASFRGVITNMRGEEMFKWGNIQEGWDGRINGSNLASEGIYYYIILIEFASGSKIEKRGSLNLVRN